jgi:Zn-dependent protease
MEAFTQWLQQLQLGGVLSGVTIVAASLLCIVFHETCHGLVALWLGDTTAKDAGRLTLNPIRHIDIFGLIMMAVFKFGWAKPVPVDMRNFRHPKRDMALTALAGPVSNLLLAMVALMLRAVLYYFYLQNSVSAVLDYLISFLEYTAVLSVGLAVFNFLPISPLDGSKVLFSFLPDRAYLKLMRYERYGMILLMVVLWTGVLDTPLTFLRSGVLTALGRVCWFPFTLLSKL